MTQRYFVDHLALAGGMTHLPPSEAQHAFRVMRLGVGDELTLFDGNGSEAAATIWQINRNECICDAQPAQAISRESATQLHLAVAIPKGDRAKEMMLRLTELGVAEVTPILASRSQRPLRENTTEKLSRIVIEASKQCGRNHLLRLNEPRTLTDFLQALTDEDEARWILHTKTGDSSNAWDTAQKRIVALIGPEGGWADQDLQAAQESGFRELSLGARILRIETAATAIAALVCCEPRSRSSSLDRPGF